MLIKSTDVRWSVIGLGDGASPAKLALVPSDFELLRTHLTGPADSSNVELNEPDFLDVPDKYSKCTEEAHRMASPRLRNDEEISGLKGCRELNPLARTPHRIANGEPALREWATADVEEVGTPWSQSPHESCRRVAPSSIPSGCPRL